MQNIHMLSIILKHDFLTSCNFTSFFQTDITPGNYLRKNSIISLFFHQISPSNAVICVHFSNFNNKLARRGNGNSSDRYSRMDFASLTRLWLRLGTQLENTVLATGSLQVSLHRVKRLLLETATTWEAGRKTCVCF